MNNRTSKAKPSQKKATTAIKSSQRRRGQREPPQDRIKDIPAAYSVKPRKSKAHIETTRRGGCRVKHVEFFRDVLGTVAGTFMVDAVNPTNPLVFPWVSGMARNYESYKFHSLRFRYDNRCGTDHGGSFAMAPDYDCNDSAPASKSELLTYDDKGYSASYEPCSAICSRENLNKRSSYYTGSVPSGKDPNLYNVANLYTYTGDNADASRVGELFVEYDVEFMTPQAYVNPFPNGIGGGWFGTTNAAPFGTSYTVNSMVSAGYIAAPVSTGTTTSVTTFTFLKAWSGVVTANYVGTTLTAITEGGTASRAEVFTEIGFGTQVADCFQVKADVGETYTLTMGNASITRADVFFGQAPTSLA
jgi:hypothetical protein